MNESVTVFATKSFWLPIAGGAVAWAATKIQTIVVLSPDDQTAITGAVIVLIIAVVRKFTNRPAHFLKPKDEET
jgi:hypothetical protein